jgi:Leucine-rich repeat (LRR) protein
MPNLESLDLSHNEIESLQPVGTVFPELVTLDISHNMICS